MYMCAFHIGGIMELVVIAIANFSVILGANQYYIGHLKMAIVGVFTPQKLEHDTNQDPFSL